ncbi:hypothetical protein B0F90DRAFT_1808391 [Multifurca ochricompacta]|uniref:Enhancer of mRNA-decapping protein 4 n=1 Tax=Multifurca ochricompacta TaxID=376703 RepID=A0AAD4MBE9_9AGAM|nr:hypothetical protein B0F90DRAFT_1808391 [Multifurca ochricompacta]
MDHHNLIRNIFSRNTSPPNTMQSYPEDQSPSAQHFPQFQHVSPSQSLKDIPSSSPPAHVESLFSNLTTPGQSSVNPNPPLQGSAQPTTTTTTTSGPTSPASSITALSAPTNMSTSTSTPPNPNPPSDSRQSALLSLLSSVSPAGSSSSGPPQQVPTPPGPPNRTGPIASNSNESQGRLLLEQLMAGNPPRSNASDTSQQRLSPPTGPSPTYPLIGPSQHPEVSSYYDPELVNPQTASTEVIQGVASAAQSQTQGSPQPNKTMFDFVSPFDALAASSVAPVRKQALPVSHQQGLSEPFEDTWSSVIDPKRKSVDNFLEQLSNTKAPVPPPTHTIPPFDQHNPDEEALVAEPVQSKITSRPLPPKPTQAPSPRGSPPKVSPPVRRDVQTSDSPLGSQAGPTLSHVPTGPAQREKESSPGPRGSWKGQEGGRNRGSGSKAKTQPGPVSQPHTIIVDVAQPLDEIQAPRDAVKSTAIALVRVDSNFLPGTTIGATHWVAYAMTKGRVRVISRSSGDRTLLQLPGVFSPTTSVTDMAVYGNRLAGVTSDGGFVVWELPDLITDDVPGKILLCVLPAVGQEALHSVKWHSKQQDTVAVASESDIYVLNITEVARVFEGEPIIQSDLHRIVQSIRMPAPLVAFEFDITHSAIATITSDSTFSLWNTRDRRPFWSTTIRGEDHPSSITFVDGGVVIGRKHGTVFQLLPNKSNNVLSTIKFINGFSDDVDMFGHANYDSRIQTLWVANNRRDSMVAFKLGFEASSPGRSNDIRPYFEQVLEFAGPKPTIHFVILTADADPRGEEAHAACVAAKVPPGELALVAFSVHSSGVDQVLIRKEWFDGALATSPAKFPAVPHLPQVPASEPRNQRQQTIQAPPVSIVQPVAQPSVLPPGPRIRTPPSAEEVEAEIREEGRSNDNRGRGRGKNVGWREKEPKESSVKLPETASGSEAQLSAVMSKEIKKMEENLYSRIGRLVGKELDKQHQRLEDVRVSEQAADITRQEKLLKLISNELTKNTTRVVEMAVKAEVQNSVLPSLENITKNEVKAVLNGQIAKGLGDSMNQALPHEIERLLLRPDVSNHVARTFSSAITPIIERHVKEAITKTLIPAYTAQSSSMHQELSREIHAEMLNIKKEVISWQSEALRGQESMIRELEQSVRTLSDQIKFLSINIGTPFQQPQVRNSPGPVTGAGTMVPFGQQPPFRHAGPPVNVNVPQMAVVPVGYPRSQASHPALPPPTQQTPPAPSEEWDDTYLAVLGTQDLRQLRELLARSNPEVVMPLKGSSPLSQAVILTLVHRLAGAIGESAPVDESFKSSMWWLQRAATVLNTNDPLIAPYTARVLPSVQAMLNTTKQRIAILPGGPQVLETARSISEIQDVLSHKPN